MRDVLCAAPPPAAQTTAAPSSPTARGAARARRHPRLTGAHGDRMVAVVALERQASAREPGSKAARPAPARPPRAGGPTAAQPPARNNPEAERSRAAAADSALSSAPASRPGFRPARSQGHSDTAATFTNTVLLSPGQEAAFTTEQNWRMGFGERDHAGGEMGPRAREPRATVLPGGGTQGPPETGREWQSMGKSLPSCPLPAVLEPSGQAIAMGEEHGQSQASRL